MKNRLSLWLCDIGLALSVAACGSGTTSNPQQGSAGTANLGSGGSVAAGSGGISTPNSTNALGGGAGATAMNTGGRSTSIGSDTTAGNSTGGILSSSGGASPAGTGGTSSGNTGGTATGNTGGATSNVAGASSTGGRTNSSTSPATGGTQNGGGSATGTGGSSTGGTTPAGGSSAQPQLITSAQNAYLSTTGAVTAVTSGTADLTVDANTKYQRWDGFGGTFNEMGWDALSVLTASEVTNALTLLFDANNGANFVFGRLPLGASDYSMSWYTLDDGAADYAMANFSIARDQQKLIPFIKAALQIRSDIRLWASPWVVPSWMMDSSSNMKTDTQTMNAHALYMAKFVEEYAKIGLKITAIHPQNEPGYARVHWTQAGLINFIKTYLGPTFAQRNVTAEIWCGTMSKDPDDTNIALATAKDADAMKYVKGFGVQWNPLAAVPTLAAKAPVMQTEHRCGNYNFTTEYWNQSQYSSSKAQNDYPYGEETWQLIRDWVVAGVNSYSAWNMVLDTVGKSLDGWPQDSLLVVDRTAKKLVITPAYYAFRHFSQYVAVGATRIAITGSGDAFKGISTQTWNGLNAVAFKNPDGSIIAEMYNKGSASKTTIVKLGNALYQFDIPAHGWATLRVPS